MKNPYSAYNPPPWGGMQAYFDMERSIEKDAQKKRDKELLNRIQTSINGFVIDKCGSKIDHCFFREIVVEVCKKKIPLHGSLFVLNFHNNDIYDADMLSLKLHLEDATAISTIYLGQTKITDRGATVLLNILENNPAHPLSEISLEYNNISQHILKRINELLERNRSIKSEIEKEQQKKDYYVEFLLVTMSFKLPSSLNTILLAYCSEVNPDLAPFIPNTVYNKILEEVSTLFLLFDNTNALLNIHEMESTTLSQRLRTLQSQLNPALDQLPNPSNPSIPSILAPSSKPVVFSDLSKETKSYANSHSINILDDENNTNLKKTRKTNVCSKCVIL